MCGMLPACLALVVIAFALALPIVWRLIGVSQRRGHVDRVDERFAHKADARPIANTGGVGVFVALALPALALLIAARLPGVSSDDGSAWSRLAFAVRENTFVLTGYLLAVFTAHIMGLVDDRRPLGPRFKLGMQLGIALFIAAVLDLRIFELLDARLGAVGYVASVVITVLWIVVITNAMNFLDNMDGLAAGVGAIIAALYLAATIIHDQWLVAIICALLVGALLAFLIFNIAPARIYMGDGGSLVVGVTLAIVSVHTTYFDPAGEQPGDWYGLLMPLMLMAVPLYDFTSVTLIRLSQGRSPLVGDRQHFSHRLVGKGLSVRGAVGVIWLCTLATGLSGVMLGTLAAWQAALAAGQTVAVIAVLALLEWSGRARP